MNTKKTPGEKKRIVIVGGGFGGVYVSGGLKKLARSEQADVTLISQSNYFLFTPLLHEVATGGLSPVSVAEPIREIIKGTKINFYQSKVSLIDTDKKCVLTENNNLPYDILVLAPGASTNFYDVPGAQKFGLPLKTLSDAVHIRAKIIDAFEEAAKTSDENLRKQILTFVVVGGGATGVELAAEIAEFIFSTIYPYYQDTFCKTRDMKVVLVSASSEVLTLFPKNIQYRARKVLEKKGVEVRGGLSVTEVSDKEVSLSNGEKIRTETVLWTAGVKAEVPEIKGKIEKHQSGRILTDKYLRVKNFDNFFVLGDSAAFKEDMESKPVPMFAQVAVREAENISKNIKNLIQKKEALEPFTYKNQGFLVSLGQWRAVGVVFGVQLQGRFAWWLWRTVYLFKFISWKKKIRIAFEWTVNLFFPRDITKLN